MHISSVKNERVKNWKKLHQRKERTKTGRFLIEGAHLVEEALKSDVFVEEIILEEELQFPFLTSLPPLQLYTATRPVIEAISETEHPQGIMAVCSQRQAKDDWKIAKRLLLLDRVQDPGNLGTIIRTADAAGIEAIVVGEGCADVYNGKTIRSTQGSLFHIPVYQQPLTDVVAELKKRNVTIFGTSLQNGKPYPEVSPSEKFALIVGNEGSGVQEELLNETDFNLYIPIYGKAESLNVAIATGILLYYLRG